MNDNIISAGNKKIILEALKENEKNKNPRTYSINLRDKIENVKVINLNLNNVFFNPRNHRLSAQISDANIDLSKQESHFTEVIQDKIKRLLIDTEDFSKLKEELKIYGQREPGLITSEGLLINGNTRCAALLELKKDGYDKGIDVAVIPDHITEDDIVAIEMDLQMMNLTHQPYTFTNELLFMSEFRKKGNDDKVLAKHMNWIRSGENKVQKHMRVLNIIEEVRKLSGNKINYKIFDSKRTHLFDLDEKMQALNNIGDIEGAEQIKWQRIFAIFINLNKDQVREIDSDFIEELSKKRLTEESKLKKFLDGFKTPIIQDDDSESEEETIDSKKLLTAFLSQDNIVNETGEIVKEFKDKNFSDIAHEMKDETDRSISQGRIEERKQELSTTMRRLRLDIEDIREKLPETIDMSGFKVGDFDFELKKAIKEIERLKSEFDDLK